MSHETHGISKSLRYFFQGPDFLQVKELQHFIEIANQEAVMNGVFLFRRVINIDFCCKKIQEEPRVSNDFWKDWKDMCSHYWWLLNWTEKKLRLLSQGRCWTCLGTPRGLAISSVGKRSWTATPWAWTWIYRDSEWLQRFFLVFVVRLYVEIDLVTLLTLGYDFSSIASSTFLFQNKQQIAGKPRIDHFAAVFWGGKWLRSSSFTCRRPADWNQLYGLWPPGTRVTKVQQQIRQSMDEMSPFIASLLEGPTRFETTHL